MPALVLNKGGFFIAPCEYQNCRVDEPAASWHRIVDRR